MSPTLLISKVLMPERGVFAVRVDEALVSSGVVSDGTTGRFIVALDYGEDVGTAIETALYDPAVHGERIPGFRMVRPLVQADENTIAENATLANDMCDFFLAAVRKTIPDIRVSSARLSFGRKKLFIRYASEQSRPNLSAVHDAMRNRFGVDVNIWMIGPRDEIAENGGLGACGRVCCCCSWQKRYPSHLAPDRRNALPSLMNGTCGRFKCCLAFERGNEGSGLPCSS